MALIHQDGFDLYNTASDLTMVYISAVVGFSPTNGRFGGGAVGSANYLSRLTYALPTPETELWMSFACKTDYTVAGDNAVMCFGSTNNVEGQITYNINTGVWTAWRGPFGTNLGSATFALVGGWHWVDVHFKYHGSAGIFELWVDDTQVFNFTGINTEYDTGTTGVVTATLGDYHSNNAVGFDYDDWFIYDAATSRLGDSRIETLVPTSDATPNDGTPSTSGAHYAMVNEAQWNTSNYVTMPDTSGDKEVYGHGSIVSTPNTVFSVKVLTVSEKTDAGSFEIEPLVKSSGTESDGAASQLLTTSWSVQSAIFENDPATSAPWTYSAANATSIGYKVV